jgi:succinoglycan biosynthesis transport protein ExoP
MHNDPVSLNPVELVQVLRSYWRWWALPAVAAAVLAAGYSLVMPRDWRATQAFSIRAEAAGTNGQLGKFADLSEMKVRQETVLELAKSKSVIEATLKAVGAPKSFFGASKNFPTAQDIEDFRENVDMRPPGGSEFGQSEVFYLSVRDHNRDRAAELVRALSSQLELRLQQLRDERATGMISEMDRSVALAEADLNDSTKQLSTFEAKIGADLPELRNLISETGSQSAVAQEAQAIAGERRANDAKRRENEQLLALLKSSENNPQQLLATPNTLLVSQPALSRLKDALVDSRVRTAGLLGTLAEAHPFVVAAKEAEVRIQNQLREEVGTAIKGLELDLQFNADRDASLAAKFDAGRERLANLAGARAEYANLVSAVENHTKLVEAARKNLADVRADHASAHTSSIITRIDGVETGIRPVGPGRTTVTAAGGVAGLICGLGLVFLFGNVVPSGAKSADVKVTKTQAEVTPVEEKNVVIPASKEPFGMFRGMTLAEAMRSVEGR